MHIDAELTGINPNYQLPAITVADMGPAQPTNLTGLNPHHPLVATMTAPSPAAEVAMPVSAPPDGGLVATTILLTVVTMCIFTLLSVLLTPSKRPAARMRRPY